MVWCGVGSGPGRVLKCHLGGVFMAEYLLRQMLVASFLVVNNRRGGLHMEVACEEVLS